MPPYKKELSTYLPVAVTFRTRDLASFERVTLSGLEGIGLFNSATIWR